MKAIVTKYHGPTNTKPSKIIATCEQNRVSLSYSVAEGEAQGTEQDKHAVAAVTLAEKMGWKGRLAGGCIVNAKGHEESYVFVWIEGGTYPVGRCENEYGLTLEEWRAAADFCCVDKVPEPVARKAWKAGEDPTEYAARKGA